MQRLADAFDLRKAILRDDFVQRLRESFDGPRRIRVSAGLERILAFEREQTADVVEDLGDLEFRPNPRLYTRTGSYVLSGYAGGYAFDRKSNSLVLGGRLGYYVFDRITAEAGIAWTHINRPAEIVESLFGLTLEAEKFHMLFYSLNLTWEILPGRQMVPFVTAGAGSAIMQGETEPAFWRATRS